MVIMVPPLNLSVNMPQWPLMIYIDHHYKEVTVKISTGHIHPQLRSVQTSSNSLYECLIVAVFICVTSSQYEACGPAGETLMLIQFAAQHRKANLEVGNISALCTR